MNDEEWEREAGGEDVLTCARCGEEYTMREFRVWCWKDYSPICWRCDSARMMEYMERTYGIRYTQTNATTTEESTM